MVQPTIADAQFEAQRGRLFSIAYRVLGRASDAEDAVQDAYRRRRDRLIAALATTLGRPHIGGTAAGMHVLLRLPDHIDDSAIATAAARKGIAVQPLSTLT